MSDFAIFKRGGVQFPLTSSTANPLLKDADPAVWYALDFYKSVLATHIGPRLLAEAAKCSAPITAAVAATTWIDPGASPIDPTFRFPLLSVFRQASEFGYRTTIWTHTTSTWGVTYLLPPLATAGQAMPLVPIFKSVEDVILDRTEKGMDPAYASGVSAWASAGIEQARFVKGSYGMFVVPDGRQFFLGWHGTLEVIEREMPATGAFGAFGAVDLHEDLVDPATQTTIADVVQDKSDVAEPSGGYSAPPTITSVTPASGPAAGGTTITLAGTNFFAGCAVSIDGVRCTSVGVASPQSLTCVTPAHAAGGPYMVAVVNANGTHGYLSQAFTYT